MSETNNNDPVAAFTADRAETIGTYRQDKDLQNSSARWLEQAFQKRYMYHFDWLGRPIIQIPPDMVAVQELIWSVKPDLIIEAGIAHGGSLILNASILAMLDYAEAVEQGRTLDPKAGKRRVLGLDIDIRAHNRAAIESHPMAHLIDMFQGSTLDETMVAKVHEYAKGYRNVLVILDSNHTHDHVLQELEYYAPLTSKGSYCLVFDTIVEDLPDDAFPDRPWAPGNSPKTAVWEYQKRLRGEGRKGVDGEPLMLEVDRGFEDKLLLTAAPDGYLRRQ